MDGTVEVTHPDSTTKTYPLERLTRLYDGIEQLEEEAWADDASEGHDSGSEVWAMDEDGKWQPDESNDPDWEDEDEVYNDAHSTMDWSYDEDKSASARQDSLPTIPPTSLPVVPLKSDSIDMTVAKEDQKSEHVRVDAGSSKFKAGDDEENWKRFDVLASAPVDHAFYSSTPATPSRAFISRINREYRALADSLPGMLRPVITFPRL